MSKVGLSAEFKQLNSLNIKVNVLYYLYTYSVYDIDEDVRRIEKKQCSGRVIASRVKDVNKDNAVKAVKVLKEQGYIEESGKYYLIHDLQKQSFRNIEVDFVKWMLREWDSRAVMTYVWLHRRFGMAKSKHESCLFTLKDIVEQVFGKDYWNGAIDKEVSGIVQEMIDLGIIEVGIKKFSEGESFTFIKQLIKINEDMNEPHRPHDVYLD